VQEWVVAAQLYAAIAMFVCFFGQSKAADLGSRRRCDVIEDDVSAFEGRFVLKVCDATGRLKPAGVHLEPLCASQLAAEEIVFLCGYLRP